MDDAWTDELATYLTDLSAVQEEMLAAMSEKRAALLASDQQRLEAVNEREAQLVERLRVCQERRGEMLDEAAADGESHASIRAMAATLPSTGRLRIFPAIDAAEHRSRLLQQECLTNWIVVQRTMLHLSQMLEIIATGGRQRPTYGKGDCAQGHGVLVDHAV